MLNARNILLICPDRRLCGELTPLLSQALPACTVYETPQYPVGRAIDNLIQSKAPALCFLDMSANPPMAFAVLEDLVRIAPKLMVVSVLPTNDPDLILKCLRTGASEFLAQPLTAEQLGPVLQRLEQLSPLLKSQAEGGARMITVMPVMGACGASTVACNLAFQWKKLGKKVLLADMDPFTGSIAFLLKLRWSYSFLDALTRDGALDVDVWKGLVATVQGVDLLLPPENAVGTLYELPDPAPIFQFCRQLYDVVIVDAPRPFGAWPLSLAKLCDDLLLVASNELPALRAAQRALEYLDSKIKNRSQVRILVNRYNPKIGLQLEAIETALQTEVYQLLPADPDGIERSLVEGKPAAAGSTFGKSIAALANALAGGKKPPNAEVRSSSWGSIFSALVSRVT